MTCCSHSLIGTLRHVSELKNQLRLFLGAGSDQLLMGLDLPIRLPVRLCPANFLQIEGVQSAASKCGSKKLFKHMIKAFKRKHYSKDVLK